MILVGREPYCDFETIQGAVDFAESKKAETALTITILSGDYHERVSIQRSNLTIRGIGEVTITNSLGANERHDDGNIFGTFRTATLYVGGSWNHLENLTIENTAGFGEVAGQALAVYADCDETTFQNCRLIGYQDTLFTGVLPDKQKDGTDFVTQAEKLPQKTYRQYYKQCFISGTIDFIFGGAMAYFEACEIRSRKEGKRNSGYVTAASTPLNQEMGFVFENCWLTAEEGVADVYLGRPWREHAKTHFINCDFGPHIHPAGWHDWSKESNRLTVDYRVTASETIKHTHFPSYVSWGKWLESDTKRTKK